MSSTSSEITDLLKSRKYDPEIIPQLENHVASQATSDVPYDSHANRTLMKLYQFFPEHSKLENILAAELLALVFGSSMEFSSLGCIINEATKTDERFTTLIRCGDLLDSCQFTEFWSVFQSISSSAGDFTLICKLAESKQAKDELRKRFLAALSVAFKSTKLSFVLKQLDFTNGFADEAKLFFNDTNLIENINEGADEIVFCDNVENTKRSKAKQDGVDYASVRALITNVQTKVAVE